MRAALLANPAINAVDDAALTGLCDAIASIVLAHIVANAAITGTCTVATTGTAAAQTGGGPITGTIT